MFVTTHRLSKIRDNGNEGKVRRTTISLSPVLGSITPTVFGFGMARQVPLSRGDFSIMVPVGLISGWLIRSWWSIVLVPILTFGGFSLSISIGRGWGGVWKVVHLPVLVTLTIGLFSPSAIGAVLGAWIGKRVVHSAVRRNEAFM